MSNSNLATWKWNGKTSNYNERDHKIDTITIHHMAGNLSLQSCCDAVNSRGGSCNYCIDTSGKIGVMIDEKYRSWCSSNRPNDMRAVTIEVANDKCAPYWTISEKAMKSLISLCVDICKRNGIVKLRYTGDTSGNMTMHRWFAATGCPGDYLAGKFPEIAQKVNTWLTTKNPLDTEGFKRGDKGLGVYALKCRLMALGYKMSDDQGFGSGTEKAVNSLLKKWGYRENGIAGEKFLKIIMR